jgi:hypothetical protein
MALALTDSPVIPNALVLVAMDLATVSAQLGDDRIHSAYRSALDNLHRGMWPQVRQELVHAAQTVRAFETC